MTITMRELRMMGVDPLALELRAWRRARELTQADVGLLLGRNGDTVCAYELGHRTLPDYLRERVAALIGAEE